MPEWENFDITNIVTSVNADLLESLLKESLYDEMETRFLTNGFRFGFPLGYEGCKNIQRTARNLPFTCGDKFILWEKLMKEVKSKRFAGPFNEIPYSEGGYVQSPIGLVPKNGNDTRLIFHLSYPRSGGSVNAGIPREKCTVHYPEFDEAVRACIIAGRNCYMAKSDMKSAFRVLPLRAEDWRWLIMMAYHPVTGNRYYFLDKCAPFGSSSSPSLYQRCSNAIAHIFHFRTRFKPINYLDDFFFVALRQSHCNFLIDSFVTLCESMGFPVSLEKTERANVFMVFLGILLDSTSQTVGIPLEKRLKALQMLQEILDKNNKKTTVLRLQKLTGTLNFLCRAYYVGRTYTRRLYSKFSSALKPYHHVNIDREMRLDCGVWYRFLCEEESVRRPFIDKHIAY